jgi:parallel beta-helix repeat protein
VLEGEIGPNNEWLTTIDGSDATSGWQPAPEIGPGVYKTTGIGYEPWAVTGDGDKNIVRICKSIDSSYCPDMASILSTPVSATHTALKGGNYDIPFSTVDWWDGVEAFFGYDGNSTFIRFRDGGSPASHNVRSAPSSGSTKINWSPNNPAIYIVDKSNVIIRNFKIVGTRYAIQLKGTGSYNNMIERNYLLTGQGRVYISGGAHTNTVRENTMENNYYGSDSFAPGPWSVNSVVPADYPVGTVISVGRNDHFYRHFKYTAGATVESMGDCSVRLASAGENNRIHDNNILNGAVGIEVYDTDNTFIYNNRIHNMAAQNIWVREGSQNARIYDNTLYEANLNIRFQELQKGDRSIYVYRNFLYNPHDLGEHLYFHFDPREPAGAPASPAEIWIYHNSLSGSDESLGIGDKAWDYGGLAKVYFLNNIFSSSKLHTAGTGLVQMGLFGYNWAGGEYPQGKLSWYGSDNVDMQNQNMWGDSSIPNYILPNNSIGNSARNAGIDISQPFTINGQTYPALPGFTAGYGGTDGKPDMGAVQSSGSDNSFDINQDGSINIQDIQICVKVITGTLTNSRADVNGDGTANIKDIQQIVKAIISP